MNAQQQPWRIAKQVLSVFALAIVLSSSAAEALHAADRTYQILPIAPENMYPLAGGTITTDGTLGLLSLENILSISVDIRLVAYQLRRGLPPEVADGSTTLDLTNATLSIDGDVLATPTGIFMVPPPQGPDPFPRDSGPQTQISIMPDPDFVSYSLALDGGDARVTWYSSNTESSGIRNSVGIQALPAGGAGRSFADSGLIAQVIPEPSTCLLAGLGGIGLLVRRRCRVRCSNVLPVQLGEAL